MKKLLCTLLALVLMLSCFAFANADEQITLTYAAKEEVELTKALAAQFEAAHPNIHVEVLELDQATFQDALANMASTQSLPDVFWTGSVTDAIANKWIINLDKFYAEDADAASISPAIMKYAQIGGKMYCFPAQCRPTVAVLNKTLFEKYNVELPAFDWTLDDFKSIAEELAHPEDFYYGVSSHQNFDEYLFTHYDWDGEKYAFGDDWISVMEMSAEYAINKVADKMTAEEKEAVLGDPNANPVHAGRVAMTLAAQEAGFEQLAGFLDGSIGEASGSEFVFYPLPSTHLESDEAIVEYAVISGSCQHPQEAWELGKWMTWGKEATLLRQDFLSKQEKVGRVLAPMIMDEAVWTDMIDKAPEMLKDFYANMEPVRPDIFPTAPNCLWMNVGYYFGGVHAMFENGDTTPADYAPTMRQMGIDNYTGWPGWEVVNAD